MTSTSARKEFARKKRILRASMRACEQMPGLSVLAHGVGVLRKYLALRRAMLSGIDDPALKIPDWLRERSIWDRQLPLAVVTEYLIYHDCGKPLCLALDEAGRRHFPDHARHSAALWRSIGGSEQVARLMAMDMDAHLLAASDVPAFTERLEAATLLVAAVAEVHANAELFGGMASVGFKAKWKHLDRRGKACLKAWQCQMNPVELQGSSV